MKPADTAWLTLAAAVTTYELWAARHRPGELLSEACDRYRSAHPAITYAVIFYLAAHLTRRWPQRYDPLHRLAVSVTR